MRTSLLLLIALILVVGGLAIAPGMNDEHQAELDHYCEMRKIERDSNGEYGWPAEAHGKFNDGDCK